MSIKIMSEIWVHADCGGSELLVLLALADFADDDGGNIYPSIPTLAKKCRLSESQTRRIMQSLVKKGDIEIVEAGGWERGRNRSNQYRIIVEALRERGSKMTPHTSRPRDHGGSADDTTVVAPTRPDPLYNQYTKPPLKSMRPTPGRKKTSAPHTSPKSYDPDDYPDIY